MPSHSGRPRLAAVTATQFRHRLRDLGISQLEASRRLGVDARTVRRWALNESPIPNPVALLLELWVRELRAQRQHRKP